MCGIAGFTDPGPEASRTLAAMAGALAHRGPDAEGRFLDPRIALGHRRLAVIDLAGGAQPRVDEASGDALVFNGEIYGYRALAEDLRRDGIALRDRSDTEVLFQMIRHRGLERTLAEVDGMFAFAFRDGATGTLHLARDRLGEKPLHYGIAAGTLVFGSEVSAIRCHPLFAGAEPDPLAAYRFLLFEYLPGNDTGWHGIRKLPAGCLLSFRDGAPRLRRFWSPSARAGAALPASEEEAADRLGALLEDAVRRQLVADVPVGIFLSGGLDSALLTAFAARHAGDITAYTVRVPEAGYDETPHAVAVARHLGVRHEVIPLAEADLVQAMDGIAGLLSEPLGDSSLLPTWLVCRAARGGVTVALGGDGADELFAGYPNFWLQRFAPAMARLPRGAGRLLGRTIEALPAGERYMGSRFLLRQLSHGLGAPMARQSFLWMAPFGPEELDRLWRPEARPRNAIEHAFAPIDAADADGPGGTPTERLLHLFLSTYLPEDILTKTDRASMFHGLEVRAPILDRAVVEFATALPTSMKIAGRSRKRVLKRVAERHLPAAIVHRRKHGFAVPIGGLLRGPLRERCADTLRSRGNPVSGWFERDTVGRLLDAHLAGRADHGKKLWSLLVLHIVAGQPAGQDRAAEVARHG